MSAEKYENPDKYKLAFIKTKSYAIIETQYSKPNCRLKRFIVPTQVKQTNHCQMTPLGIVTKRNNFKVVAEQWKPIPKKTKPGD